MKAHTCAPMHNVAAAPHSALRQISYDLLTDADLDEAPQVLLEHQVDPPLHSHTACPPSRLPSYPPLPRLLPPSAPQLSRLLPRSLPPPDAHTRSPTARCTRTHTHKRYTVTGLARLLVRLRCCLWSATPSTGVRGCTRQCARSSRVAEARSSCPGTRCAHPAATRGGVRERMSARARVPADACCVRLHACTSAANGATGARIAALRQ